MAGNTAYGPCPDAITEVVDGIQGVQMIEGWQRCFLDRLDDLDILDCPISRVAF
jgi:hypothetical protein